MTFAMTLRLIHGDCRDVLATLPDDSVHCCVTSPPYWGLRSYLPAGHSDKHLEIGSEPTIDEWVRTLVEVFRQVRRLLRDDGTLWLNLGDSYAGSWGAQSREHAGKHASNVSALSANQVKAAQRKASGTGSIPPGSGWKPKDLIGQPWVLAFALRADGWYLRQEIIWHKKNPMPESVRDRCTKAHEHVFLLSKRPTYYYDFKAIQESASQNTHDRMRKDRASGDHKCAPDTLRNGLRPYKTPDGWDTSKGEGGHGTIHKAGREKGRKLAEASSGTKNNDSFDAAMAVMPEKANKRSVWSIASAPFSGAHFATFPPALVEPCILAGCPLGGVVLDPFGGSGTTGLVADRLHRHCILIDLDERNKLMATERITADSPLFAEIVAA